VEATVAARDTLALEVRAVGSLEADAQVQIRPEIDGHVTSIDFREGAEVRRGEVLVRMDQNKLRAQLQAARAALERARAEAENLQTRLRRNDSLLAQGAISQQAYDDVETDYNTARARLQESEANLELARQRLEDATLRAPFSGRVGARQFDLGDYVSVGDDLFTLVDDDPMEIRFSVPERYLGQLQEGSPVSLTVRSMPDRTFRGKVDFVSPYVDSRNRTVELKARIPNPASELRAGQFADVRLQLQSRPATVIPEAAVVPRQDGNFVFRVEGGRAQRAAVEIGARRRGFVEVLSGVEAGDTVVVAGQQRLQPGASVALTMEDGPVAGDADGADGGEADAGDAAADGPDTASGAGPGSPADSTRADSAGSRGG
jgi:membrane fusion protein (multidrug efflux system)